MSLHVSSLQPSSDSGAGGQLGTELTRAMDAWLLALLLGAPCLSVPSLFSQSR